MARRKRVRALILAVITVFCAAGVAFATLPQQNGTVDLATQSQVRLDGAATGDVFGEQTASAGDFNGDGIGDVAVTNGAHAYAWIVFGSSSGNVDLASPGARAIKVTAPEAFQSVSGGQDINGDGLADVVFGDGNADSAYVVFGSKTPSNVNVASLGSAGFKMSGAAGDGTGIWVSESPDMNADGKGEVVVGAYSVDNNAKTDSGSTYVVFGTASTSTISLPALGAGGFRIDGATAGDFSGSAVAGGADLTGDHVPDVLVGAPGANAGKGAVWVVAGKATTTNINLATLGTGGYRIDGQAASDQLPRTVAITADMNGDGMGEAIVGTDFADNNGSSSGSAWVVFGKSSSTAVDLANLGSAGFRIDGQAAGNQASRSVGAPGDVNGDGLPDVVVGALFADNAGRTNSGSMYVVYGKASATTVNLNTLGSGGFRVDGAVADDSLGRGVSGAGDFNGDGRPDVVGGAEFADPFARTSAGSAFVVYGFGQPAFAYGGPYSESVGTAIDPILPTNVKRTGTATFSAPTLPAGLSLDSATGAISGTPTAASDDKAYSVTMSDLAGVATAQVHIAVAGPPPTTTTQTTTTPTPISTPTTPTLLPGACSNPKTGTAKADILVGTSAGDLIRGGAGNDKISGGAGADCLFGQAGNDKLLGGAGNDKLDGGKGNDNLNGGKGKDTVVAGAGNDTINSRDGIAESINCGKGRDVVKADKKDKTKGCEKVTRR